MERRQTPRLIDEWQTIPDLWDTIRSAVDKRGEPTQDLINDLETFGLIFENMAVRDLRVYAEALSGKLYHYRDNTGLECDAVLHRRDGTYGLVEVKLGGEKKIVEGVTSLMALADKIDTTKMPKPSFMMVLTAVGDYAYTRPDGIHVVPICCLKN